MTKSECRQLVADIPPRLSYSEVARRLGVSPPKARKIIDRAGYRAVDGRSFSQNAKRRFVPEDADWKRSNIELARLYGVTRERVRVLRKQLGKPFVESRGRKASVQVRIDKNSESVKT